MFKPNPGAFNHQIDIQSYTQSKDASGGQVKTWGTIVASPFVSINNLSGVEKDATRHGGEVAISRTIFTMHYITGITEDMRVVHEGRYYDINHVNNYFEKNHYLILTCKTGVNDG